MAVTYTTTNLIVNPGAELGASAPNFNITTPPQSWTVTSNFSAVDYLAGSPSDLNPASSAAISGGLSYFAGGPNNANATAAQTISLAAYGAAIDAGGVTADLSGWFGGFSSQLDRMALTIQFLDINGAALGLPVTIEGPGPVERGNFSLLLLKSALDLAIPVGARGVLATLIADRGNGSYNDGYADNLSLTLHGPANTFGGGVRVSAAGVTNFTAEVITAASGIVFVTQADATGSFLASQFGAGGIGLTGLMAGGFFDDKIDIAVAAGGTFSAAGFQFAGWTENEDRITLTGGAGAESITGSSQSDTLQGLAGNDTLMGGAGADGLNGGTETDTASYANATVRVKSSLDGSIAGEGDAAGDTFTLIERLSGSGFSDVLRGDGNANRLLGGNGADTLQGMAGNDSFLGGNGADALTGGLGNDFFDYTALTHRGDTIKDFHNVAGDNDTLRFTGSVFGGLPVGALAANRFVANATGTATTVDHRFIYETDTGILRYDSNGSLAGGALVIATLTGAPVMTAADIVII